MSSSNANEESPLVEVCARTSLKKVRFSYRWTVEDFRARREQTGEFIESPSFTTSTGCEWRLKLWPRGISSSYAGCIGIYLELVSCQNTQVWVTYTISIVNDKLEKSSTGSYGPTAFTKGSSSGMHSTISTSAVTQQGSSLLVDNNLVILCEGTVESTEVQFHATTVYPLGRSPSADMNSDLGVLLESGEFSDVTLRVDGAEFKAHKAILALRSPVFGAMFRNEMVEKQRNEVNIEGIDKNVFKNLLAFIYTGKVADLEKIGAELLAAADRFDVGGLKTVCEEKMALELSVRNAANVLGVADMYHAELLQSRALAYMVANFHEVVNTDAWMTLVHERAVPASKVMGAVAKKLNCV